MRDFWFCLGIGLLTLFLPSSCKVKNSETPVARVYDNFLYPQEISAIVPPMTSPKDSQQLAEGYINNWIQQKLIMKKAELNLPEEMKNVEKQLNDYRTSLIIYAYEKELVRQKLDTAISAKEVEDYYKNHIHEFELKDYIVKVLYVKLDKNSPEINKVRKWFKSEQPDDLKKLEEYCRKFAVNFFVDTEAWLFFDDLLKEIPIETFNKEDFLRGSKPMEFMDEGFIFFLNILDYRLKDDISPLSLVNENIRNIILNKRKITLIETMRKDIFRDALEKGNFEIFSNQGINYAE